MPRRSMKGPLNTRWKGGRRTRPDGYVDCYAPDHPHASRNRVLEHRLVMEKVLGRILEPHEVVHHKNENRGDNRPENLELTNHADHARHHFTGRRYPNRWKPRVTKARLVSLYVKRHLTLRECADEVGISYGSLRLHCLRYGIEIRRPDPWFKRKGRRPLDSREPSLSISGKRSRTRLKGSRRTKGTAAA